MRSALFAAWLALVLACSAALPVCANGVDVLSARIVSTDEGFALDADFDLKVSQLLQDAVSRGIPLYFVLEVDISKPRWYWRDEKLVSAERTWRLTYTPLLEQYRLQSGLFTQNFTRFEDVRRTLSRVRSFAVTGRDALRKGETYQAFVRFRLDATQLPKPLQVSAVGSKDWTLSSDWVRIEVKP